MHHAAINGHIDVAEWLLSAGASVTDKDEVWFKAAEENCSVTLLLIYCLLVFFSYYSWVVFLL